MSSINNNADTSAETNNEWGCKVYDLGELFGVIVDENTLNAEQLRQAVANYERYVVRRPDGEYDMIDPQCKSYRIVDDEDDEEAA
jgi:hypothetical protein